MEKMPLKLNIITQIRIQPKIHLKMRQSDSTTQSSLSLQQLNDHVLFLSILEIPSSSISAGPPGGSCISASVSWSVQVLTRSELKSSSFNMWLNSDISPLEHCFVLHKKGLVWLLRLGCWKPRGE